MKERTEADRVREKRREGKKEKETRQKISICVDLYITHI